MAYVWGIKKKIRVEVVVWGKIDCYKRMFEGKLKKKWQFIDLFSERCDAEYRLSYPSAQKKRKTQSMLNNFPLGNVANIKKTKK